MNGGGEKLKIGANPLSGYGLSFIFYGFPMVVPYLIVLTNNFVKAHSNGIVT
ncbi:MAG: hypothetical protein Ta2E_00710 [Mycoplasmoidaceae bacterium]|nr:MAG: hypothetical protein Ta2E_00710 [Mycoplasmoidaceae bacterium]